MEADLIAVDSRALAPRPRRGLRVSWALGVLRFCAPAILLVIGWHLARHERREALAWLAVGVGAAVLPELVKAVVARPRPTLWPWLIPTSGYSFPSGHAVAGAALYPLLGWLALRSRGQGLVGYLLGLAVGRRHRPGAPLRRRPLAERRARRVGAGAGPEPRRRPLARIGPWTVATVRALTAPAGSSRVDVWEVDRHMTPRANTALRTDRGGAVCRWRPVFHYWHP